MALLLKVKYNTVIYIFSRTMELIVVFFYSSVHIPWIRFKIQFIC